MISHSDFIWGGGSEWSSAGKSSLKTPAWIFCYLLSLLFLSSLFVYHVFFQKNFFYPFLLSADASWNCSKGTVISNICCPLKMEAVSFSPLMLQPPPPLPFGVPNSLLLLAQLTQSWTRQGLLSPILGVIWIKGWVLVLQFTWAESYQGSQISPGM